MKEEFCLEKHYVSSSAPKQSRVKRLAQKWRR